MREFNSKEDLEFSLPESFKGLSKEYMLECIFDEEIQKTWKPQIGDIIVGCTGNVFVISGVNYFSKRLGGKLYYFGGSSCGKNGSSILENTYCYTANESGKYIHPIEGEQYNPNHCLIREFRYVPYPHERK